MNVAGHNTAGGEKAGTRGYRIVCECGYSTSWRLSRHLAVGEHRAHVLEMLRAGDTKKPQTADTSV